MSEPLAGPKPSIGTLLYFWTNKEDYEANVQPFAAHVAYVHSDTLVNISYVDQNGVKGNQVNVPIIWVGDPIPACNFCKWP